MNNFDKKIAITTGDVNGIGAEITIKALNSMDLPCKNIVLISNKKVLDFYGKLNKNYQIEEIEFDESDMKPGLVTQSSGEFSYQALKKACELAKKGLVDAIVTAPVSKQALHDAGYIFNGQTEVLQNFLADEKQHAEMLFLAKDFRVLLLTRHIPLLDVDITEKLLVEKILALNEFFQKKLKIEAPKFAYCALNPHAGEGGIIGTEEVNVLIPAVEKLKRLGVDITLPLPADTLFIKAANSYFNNLKSPYDCYIANYHDQGLIPIKTVAADKTVNMTIGLDVIRTSPCHGTAFDIAGKNIASFDSMIEAIKAAISI